jgi:hypothetical protein
MQLLLLAHLLKDLVIQFGLLFLLVKLDHQLVQVRLQLALKAT